MAAPFALVVGLVVAGSLQRSESPIADLAQPGAWTGTQAAPAAMATGPVHTAAIDSATPVAPSTTPVALQSTAVPRAPE